MPQLQVLREQIDSLDAELLQILAKRMETARLIGEQKKEAGMSVLQFSRFREVIRNGIAAGKSLGLDPKFVHDLLMAIHEESVRQQVEMLKKER